VSTTAAVRVCVCRGTWQLLTLSASLREHERVGGPRLRTTLALSGERLSQAMRRRLDDFAARLGLEDVRWIDDVVAEATRLSDRDFARRLALLRRRLGAGAPDEVWIANPRSPLDRVVLEAFPRSRLVLYEDGLGTYAAPWADAAPLALRLRITARTLLAGTGRAPGRRARLLQRGVRPLGRRARQPDAVYLHLAHVLGVPPLHRASARVVEPAVLRAVLERVAYRPEEAPNARPGGPAPRGTALVLGSSYSFWGAMSRAEELELYAGVVSRVAAAGYDVLWKEHPRTLAPFLPELRRAAPEANLRAFGEDPAVPLELYLLRRTVDLLVAGTSSSLLYVPLLLGDRTRVATFAPWLAGLVGGPRRDIVRLVEATVPPLDAVLALPASSGAGGEAVAGGAP
jgi:hypothetical protein